MTWEGGAPLQDYRRPKNLSLKGPNLQNQQPSSVDQQLGYPNQPPPTQIINHSRKQWQHHMVHLLEDFAFGKENPTASPSHCYEACPHLWVGSVTWRLVFWLKSGFFFTTYIVVLEKPKWPGKFEWNSNNSF
jgi:hypothetical protein